MKKFRKILLCSVVAVVIFAMSALAGCKNNKETELLDLDVTGIEITNLQSTFTPGTYEITAKCLPYNTKHQGFTAKVNNDPQSVGMELKDGKYILSIGKTALDGSKITVQVTSTYEKTVKGSKDFILSIPEPTYVMISTEDQLIDMKNDMSGTFKLANDIALTKDWVQIGDARAEQSGGVYAEALNPFNGVLDGNGYSIKNIKMVDVSETGYNRGFFGQLTAAAVVRNIGFEGVKMEFRGWSGVIAGHNFGVIKNVFTNIPLTVDGGVAGALVAMNNGNVENSYAIGKTISTSNNDDKAGLIGVADGSQIGCYADRESSGLNYFAGFRKQNENETWNMKYLISTELMQTADTFINAGWDQTIWDIADFKYPTLKHK